MSRLVHMVNVHVRIDGRWHPSREKPTPFRRHPALWGLDALLRGELGEGTVAQFVSWPFGDDDLRPWLERWLGDLPEHGYDGWGRVLAFAEAAEPHRDHPLALAGTDVQAVEMQMPLVQTGPDGVVVTMFPVRLLGREGSPASMIVWGPPAFVVGDPETLAEPEQATWRSAVAGLDYRVRIELVVADESLSADDVNWIYVREVVEAIDRALTTIITLVDELETALLARPYASELVSSLQTLGALRRALPFVIEGLGPRWRSSTERPGEEVDPDEQPHPLFGANARGREVLRRAEEAEQRIRSATDLLSQVATGIQLVRAREDSDRARTFQITVAILASVAVVPGALAAWFQAAEVEVAGLALAGYMLLAAVVTAALLASALVRRRAP